jgi:predicted SAM-dependent methyltransferase
MDCFMTQNMTLPEGERTVASALPVGPKLNVGCGPIQPDGWVNIDSSHRARLASHLPWVDALLVRARLLPPTEFNRRTTVRDVRSDFGMSPSSVAAIYCGEILEHFTEPDGNAFLESCFRVLAPGGVLRVRVPDHYRFWKNYVTEYEKNETLLPEVRSDSHVRWTRMYFRDICVKRPRLSSMGHYHKWMYDEISLLMAFEKVGFVDTTRCSFHTSRITDVHLVEARDDLIVEGVKPISNQSR